MATSTASLDGSPAVADADRDDVPIPASTGTLPATLASPLRRARRRAGMTVAELAAAADVSEGTIRNAETGRHQPVRGTRRRIAAALGADVGDLFDVDERIQPPTPQTITWPPPADDLNKAVQAYRAAGDATGAGELLSLNQETVRQRLNRAGCRPRPRGGSNADGIESLASWARKLGVPIADAVDAAQRGRVPGLFVQQLDDPVLGCRWAVRTKDAA